MPEGDTIHHAARRVGAALVGREIVDIETPQPRHRHHHFAERLEGRAVHAVDAKGKHLFVRFDGDLAIHSHLRMGGRWDVYRRGQPWRRADHRAWLVVRTTRHEVVQFDGPVLELVADRRLRSDRRFAVLGPDVLADEFDERRFLSRLREDEPTRGIGDALLDQGNVAGLGNIWKSESCFLAGIDPWRPVGEVENAEALEIVRRARPLMERSAERGGRIVTWQPERPPRRAENRTWVYRRAGLPCRHCGTLVEQHGQGDDNRTTYWCPSCQR